MLDSELNSHDTENNPAGLGGQDSPAGVSQEETETQAHGLADGGQEPASVSAAPASVPAAPTVPAALFQPPQVLFQPPAAVATPPAGGRDTGAREAGDLAGSGQQDR